MRGFLLGVVLPALLAALLPAPAVHASTADLKSLLDRRLASFHGGVGIFVSDPLADLVLYTQDPDELVVAASLYKLAVLLEAERRVEARGMRYEDSVSIEPEDVTDDGAFEVPGTVLTLDEALERMITLSDNGSALALMRVFGVATINATLERYGISAFHLANGDGGDYAASPRGVATFFTLLARKQLVSAAASERMLARLERQTINDRLPAQLPRGTRVAHKTGNLGYVTHDAGLIFGKGDRPVVVVAMTWDCVEAEAIELLEDIGSLVYANAFEAPANVGYVVPHQPVPADAGHAMMQNVRLTNFGPGDWKLDDPDPFHLVWEMSDASGAVVARSLVPIALGELKADAAADLPLVLPVPEKPGDYRVTVALADGAHGALSPLGVATDSFVIRAHPPFLVRLDVELSPQLHRQEASMFVATLHPTMVLTAKQSLALGWRVLDPRNGRVVAQGQTALGIADPEDAASALGYLVAPAIRGRYPLELFALHDGEVASAALRRTVDIGAARTFGDQPLPGGTRGAAGTVGARLRRQGLGSAAALVRAALPGAFGLDVDARHERGASAWEELEDMSPEAADSDADDEPGHAELAEPSSD